MVYLYIMYCTQYKALLGDGRDPVLIFAVETMATLRDPL